MHIIRTHGKNILITAIIAACALVTQASACDLDALNRGQSGHGCTPDTGPGVTSSSINPGTSYKTLIELKPSSTTGLSNKQRISKPGDAVPNNTNTYINRFGPPDPSRPDLRRRIYLTDGWVSTHGTSAFPLNVKSWDKYKEFRAHLENRDKGHECYYPTTNTQGGCLECKADWTPRNYLSSGPKDCGRYDTGWRPRVEGMSTVPDGKSCPRAFFTNACSPRPDHTPPTPNKGRTCDPERDDLNDAYSDLAQCQADPNNNPNVDCAGEQAGVTSAQDNLNDCLALPSCQWNYNPGNWSLWKPAQGGECANHTFVQSRTRTLNPTTTVSANSCRRTEPDLSSHSEDRYVSGTRDANDIDCGGGTTPNTCTVWETGNWQNPLSDTELAATTCIGDTVTNSRSVTPGPAPCTGTPASNPPPTTKIIDGTKQCGSPVAGVCNNDVVQGCNPGNPISFDNINNTWTCEGENGGSNSMQCQYVQQCSPAVNGQCNNSVLEGCNTGTSAYLDTVNKTWLCEGCGGGSTDHCVLELEPINGECDDSAFGQCSAGDPTLLNTGNNTWMCQGRNGGSMSGQCLYNPNAPVNGQCDTSNEGQCVDGTPTQVVGNTWNCLGDFGGSTEYNCAVTNPHEPDPTNQLCPVTTLLSFNLSNDNGFFVISWTELLNHSYQYRIRASNHALPIPWGWNTAIGGRIELQRFPHNNVHFSHRQNMTVHMRQRHQCSGDWSPWSAYNINTRAYIAHR